MSRSARRANGDGSITRRVDGRWMGRYQAWTTAGTRKRATVYGHTRQEAVDRDSTQWCQLLASIVIDLGRACFAWWS
jgi:hypothetical protein